MDTAILKYEAVDAISKESVCVWYCVLCLWGGGVHEGTDSLVASYS